MHKAHSSEPLLYLVHRIPYPPNKGDKVRSFNILRQLALRHRVFLATFVDQPEDMQYVESLGQWCESVYAEPIQPAVRKLASLRGLLSGEALSVPFYRSGRMRDWVSRVVAESGIRKAVAFSGPMAQYLDVAGLETRVVDFCDLDSAKWTSYAAARTWPMSWLYRREGDRLFAFEREWAERAEASSFVTEAEADLLRERAPAVANRVFAVQNGVDSDFFAPQCAAQSPYPAGCKTVVFTGAMDYFPNIDAVSWFARDILPRLRAECPGVVFYIVGMNPAAEVLALAGPDVVVTGKVPDVRPWLAHADVVVAPLRIARGIQNKVLEAMAMGRPVIVSAEAATGLHGQAGLDYVVAAEVEDYVRGCADLLEDVAKAADIGACARQCVVQQYSWGAHLERFDALLTEHDPQFSSGQREEGAPLCSGLESSSVGGSHAGSPTQTRSGEVA